MAKYLDSTGLTHLWAKIKNYVQTYVSNLNLADTYVAKESGKGLSTNDYTTTEKTKLSNIASGAEVNQNAFSNVKVGSTTVAADAKTDTLTLAAGGDVTITPDATNDKVTISVTTPKKVSDLTNDSGFITLSQVPEGAAASSTTPLQDGKAAVGTETAFARGDHRHPTDISRAADNDVVHLNTTSIEHIMGDKEFNGNIELGTYGWSQLVDASSSPIQTLAEVIDDLETAISSKADTTNLPKATTTTPKMDGTAAVGTETAFARGDHRHPSDTTKQDVISDLATIRSGAAAGATAYQLPSTGMPSSDMSDAVQASLAKANSAMQSGDLPKATTTTPKMNGTAAVGTETKWAKGDHVHPSDTSKLDTVDTISDAQINGLFATISFTISGVSYEADDGMTWADWVSSSYNTDGYREDNGELYNSEWAAIENTNSQTCMATDYIINGGTYRVE